MKGETSKEDLKLHEEKAKRFEGKAKQNLKLWIKDKQTKNILEILQWQCGMQMEIK